MSKTVPKVADTVFPGAGTAGGEAGKVAQDLITPKVPGPLADERAPTDSRIAARSEDFETRRQTLGRAAIAAGVTRSDNEADTLGYALPRRRAGAARQLLG